MSVRGISPTAFRRLVTPISFLIGVAYVPEHSRAHRCQINCCRVFQVRGGADSVGRQTTVGVVWSIFLVIAADALFSVILGGVGLWR